MKRRIVVRQVLVRDKGPFLAGVELCNHVHNGGSAGLVAMAANCCTRCNGTGIVLIPVVADFEFEDELGQHEDTGETLTACED